MGVDVVVLGADGTLGHLAVAVLSRRARTIAAARSAANGVVSFDVEQPDRILTEILQRVRTDGLVVNAIAMQGADIADGSSAVRERAITINSLFPHRLARIAGEMGLKVAHISTDAVFARDVGEVNEDSLVAPQDFYGLSKAAGETIDQHCLTVRCSIIGPPAPHRTRGLWAWIKSQPNGATIQGYENQSWSGLTTLQLVEVLAALCDSQTFARARTEGPIHHLAPNPVLSKCDLLRILSEELRPDLKIVSCQSAVTIKRVLVSRNKTLATLTPQYTDWSSAVRALASMPTCA